MLLQGIFELLEVEGLEFFKEIIWSIKSILIQ